MSGTLASSSQGYGNSSHLPLMAWICGLYHLFALPFLPSFHSVFCPSPSPPYVLHIWLMTIQGAGQCLPPSNSPCLLLSPPADDPFDSAFCVSPPPPPGISARIEQYSRELFPTIPQANSCQAFPSLHLPHFKLLAKSSWYKLVGTSLAVLGKPWTHLKKIIF